ncbi:MAG: quinone oxidoreductase family protein [Bacteroidota bacterium]
MHAYVLTQHGAARSAFTFRECPEPQPAPDEVLIAVEAFGLNFADVMARRGMYRDAPPMPSILGYEVVGRIAEDYDDLKAGTRVLAFTRFGAYAQRAVAKRQAVVPIDDEVDAGEATALATQYCTAWFCAQHMAQIFPGDHVLIQAAAGGVGTALVQIARHRGAVVYGTAGSDEKLAYLKTLGVDVPINYRRQDFYQIIRQQIGHRGIDLAFDSVGGEVFKKSQQLLGPGGRIIAFGGASRKKGIFNLAKFVWEFGITVTVKQLMSSQGIIGVNMLHIADARPDYLQQTLQAVVSMHREGVLKPTVGGRYHHTELGKAHSELENRRTIGKLAVYWAQPPSAE